MTVQTDPGQVMGTVSYMSPEQVRGKQVDHLSDIFSFGVVLYELLAGARAFKADTAVETMTAILKQDPPELSESIPAGVRQIVSNCLEKDPANRFQSARDLAFALGALSQTGAQSGSSPALAKRSSLPWWATSRHGFWGHNVLGSRANGRRSRKLHPNGIREAGPVFSPGGFHSWCEQPIPPAIQLPARGRSTPSVALFIAAVRPYFNA